MRLAAQPLVKFPSCLTMEPLPFSIPRYQKEKVVIVMGATGTGKSRLSIDLATRFSAEIVNSDKMQVYKGLDITTNKVTEDECGGVPHHLLGIMDPNSDFTASDFGLHASLAVQSILGRKHLPIIAGGSNSYIKALVNDHSEFKTKYECCFLCVGVSLPILHSFVSNRVNRMVEAGLVEEVRPFFNPDGDYTRGIRQAIGVRELDQYFRINSGTHRSRLLRTSIDNIKSNTCKMACDQLGKILRLQNQLEWKMHHLDATEAFLKRGAEADETWDRLVVGPSTVIIRQFLNQQDFASPTIRQSRTSAIPVASVLGVAGATSTMAAAA